MSVAFPLYFDEDSVNRALIRALLARGVDVTNAIDAGHAGSPGRVQLEHATADRRVLFTYMRRILRMNRERSSDDMRDRVEFLGSWSISRPESDQPI